MPAVSPETLLLILLRCFRLIVLCGVVASYVQADVSYNRDVLPILSAKCFRCHGVDEAARQANLRLDNAAEAFADRDGKRAIVPHAADRSELVRRILSTDTDEVMPPIDERLQLDEREKHVLKQWIGEGAVYEEHWAFRPPRKAAVPNSAGSPRCRGSRPPPWAGRSSLTCRARRPGCAGSTRWPGPPHGRGAQARGTPSVRSPRPAGAAAAPR